MRFRFTESAQNRLKRTKYWELEPDELLRMWNSLEDESVDVTEEFVSGLLNDDRSPSE
jgi:hypothetical protein